ncbi:MAG: RNA-binding protein [Candidatus Thermoplasmatota archaeon]|nr:RNA-binding protein [Candidatus Thermoplasmatota archaeon]
MKNLEQIVDKIGKSIDEKDKAREHALRASRDIIISCRKAIQCLHQEKMKDASTHIKKGHRELTKLYEITKDYSDLSHAGFVENAAQEVVEAQCLLNIMKGKELPDPDEMKTTYSSYLLGLCDVVGELRRRALDFIRKGKEEKANECLDMMEEIYNAIIHFDYPSTLVPIRKKQDMARGLIERTRGELAIASCERRIEYRTDEFRGILDRMNGNDGATKPKKGEKTSDLDIDKVW